MNQRISLGVASVLLVLALGAGAIRLRLTAAQRDYQIALRVQGRDQVRRLERTLDLDAGHVPARLLLAHDLMALGEYRRALGHLGQLLHVASSRRLNSADLLQNQGEALYELGKYAEAEQSFRQALALNPGAPVTHLYLARSLKALNHPDDAIAEYRKAVGPRSFGEQAYLELGTALLAGGKQQDVAALGRELQSGGPELAMDWHRILLERDLQLGRTEDALLESHRAAKANPGSPWPHLQASGILARSGQTHQAVNEALAAQAIAPADPLTRLSVASSLEADQQWDRAVAGYKTVETTWPQEFARWVGNDRGPRADNPAILAWQEKQEALINPGDLHLMGPDTEPGIQQAWYPGDSGEHAASPQLANSLFIQGALAEVRHDYTGAGQLYENALHYIPVAESTHNTPVTNRLREAIEIGIDSLLQARISGHAEVR